MVRNVSRTKTNTRKLALVIGSVVVLLVAAFFILKATGMIFSDKSLDSSTASQYTKGEGSGGNGTKTPSDPGDNNDGPSTDPVDKNGDDPVNTPSTLLVPSGTFISNHRISLSDGAQTAVKSSCNTTPGVSCSISFASGSTTKKLTAKTTDAGGAAYWTWNVKDLGLTSGKWQITMVASQGSSQETSTDALSLEITQ